MHGVPHEVRVVQAPVWNNLKYFKCFYLKNGSSQGKNLASTVLIVPFSLDGVGDCRLLCCASCPGKGLISLSQAFLISLSQAFLVRVLCLSQAFLVRVLISLSLRLFSCESSHEKDRICFGFRLSGVGVRGSGFRFRVSGVGVRGSRFRIRGSGFGVQGWGSGLWALGSGLRCAVLPGDGASHRPGTEPVPVQSRAGDSQQDGETRNLFGSRLITCAYPPWMGLITCTCLPRGETDGPASGARARPRTEAHYSDTAQWSYPCSKTPVSRASPLW